MPLTMVVPFLNVLSYVLQLIGLLSIYSANKWRSFPVWIYIGGMVCQFVISNWFGCAMMIVAVLWNAKGNQFVYGKQKIFKESVI